MKKTLISESIRSINKLLIKGDISVVELHDESSKIIKHTQPYNPFITVCEEQSAESAKVLDNKLKSNGKPTNPLFGIPISIKDNFCTDKILTTCASKMLYNFVPNYTASPVSRLLDSDCIIMGKTNMDEFAMGSSSVTSYYGPTANTCGEVYSPSNSWFMAGGSSTGSAVSVASGACFASLGSDTGGSTRQPASLTGIVGFKPTYGLISRFGLIPLANCLDVVSILTRRVDDAELIFNTIVGRDVNDLTSVDHRQHLESKFIDHKTSPKIRIGIPDSFISKGDVTQETSDRFDKIIARLKGDPTIELISINLEYSRLSSECYTIIACSEICSNMSRYDGVKYGFSSDLSKSNWIDREQFFRKNRDNGFGNEVKKRILLGNYFLMSENRDTYLSQANKLRRAISEEFKDAFINKNIDFILTPSTPTTSITYKEWLNKQSDNKLFHEDYFLIPSNLANLPSISLPAGCSKLGLPIGIQLIANTFRDEDLLFISKVFESKLLNIF